MFSESFGDLLGIRGKITIPFIDCPYGAAVARLKFLQLCEYVVLTGAGAKVPIVLFGLSLCVLEFVRELLFGQGSGMVLQVPETLSVAGVGISRVDVCANDWVYSKYLRCIFARLVSCAARMKLNVQLSLSSLVVATAKMWS